LQSSMVRGRYRQPGDLVSFLVCHHNVVTAISLTVGGKFAGELYGLGFCCLTSLMKLTGVVVECFIVSDVKIVTRHAHKALQ
jgi:hypothetical protein